jgi:hypothetical protein
MARNVLLIEPDVDALGKLAEGLRARGLTVHLADDVPSAKARARSQLPQVVLVAASVARRPDFSEAFIGDPQIGLVPRVVLVRAPGPHGLPLDHATYDDVDRLVSLVVEVSPPSVAPDSLPSELRGDLRQVPLVDLLQLLAMNRRTGVLTVSTPAGAGELRVSDGEVLDAVYRRLEGEKAFYRLLAEREGTFVFSPGTPPAVARVTTNTSALLMEAMRQKDELERVREQLGSGDVAFIAGDERPEDNEPRLLEDILTALASPRTLSELIDELPSPDLEVLQGLVTLIDRGMVRRVTRGSDQTPLSPPEQLSVLKALAAKLARDGFQGPPRVVIASTPSRLHALGHALLRVAGATSPAEPAPSAPVPHELGLLRLGEGVELAFVGLPIVEAFSPLWSLTLPGTGLLVRLDAQISPMLDAVSRALEIRSVLASDIVPGFDELDPVQVAQLLRGIIEQGAAS